MIRRRTVTVSSLEKLNKRLSESTYDLAKVEGLRDIYDLSVRFKDSPSAEKRPTLAAFNSTDGRSESKSVQPAEDEFLSPKVAIATTDPNSQWSTTSNILLGLFVLTGIAAIVLSVKNRRASRGK